MQYLTSLHAQGLQFDVITCRVMPQFTQISTEAASSLLLLSSLLMYLKIIIIVTTPMAIKEQMAGRDGARWSPSFTSLLCLLERMAMTRDLASFALQNCRN
jgi:hypothetical protein